MRPSPADAANPAAVVAASMSITSSKRSPAGSNFDLDRLVALCRRCHEQTDASLAVGWLIVSPLGRRSVRL
jgi:hypothetical protein